MLPILRYPLRDFFLHLEGGWVLKPIFAQYFVLRTRSILGAKLINDLVCLSLSKSVRGVTVFVILFYASTSFTITVFILNVIFFHNQIVVLFYCRLFFRTLCVCLSLYFNYFAPMRSLSLFQYSSTADKGAACFY